VLSAARLISFGHRGYDIEAAAFNQRIKEGLKEHSNRLTADRSIQGAVSLVRLALNLLTSRGGQQDIYREH